MSDTEKTVAKKIDTKLKKLFPKADCALEHKNPLELLVATILSVQCTDARVNVVTKDLFKKYKTANNFAEAPITELEEDIRSTGFYRNKAKSIQRCCFDIASKHGGKVPHTMKELTKLAGVGRKTASVVLGVSFGKAEGVVVDTHVGRLSQRWGLTAETGAEKIEKDLMSILPKKEWIGFSHRVILFGRSICQAKKPKCKECAIEKLCDWSGKQPYLTS